MNPPRKAPLVLIALATLLSGPALQHSRSLTAPACFGRTATIVGTAGRDVLTGTSQSDVIVTLEGRDIVSGGPGNDLICGGDGSDGLSGQAGDDRIRGGGAGDDITGGGRPGCAPGGLGERQALRRRVLSPRTRGLGGPDHWWAGFRHARGLRGG